jgi:prevent-host-death family protein
MIIIPSTNLRNQYNEISERCKTTGEPIYLTKNGEGDLVVMSVEAYEKQLALLKLKEKLLDIELEQKNGAKFYSLDELDAALRKIVGNE